jgi:hypothetical protein
MGQIRVVVSHGFVLSETRSREMKRLVTLAGVFLLAIALSSSELFAQHFDSHHHGSYGSRPRVSFSISYGNGLGFGHGDWGHPACEIPSYGVPVYGVPVYRVPAYRLYGTGSCGPYHPRYGGYYREPGIVLPPHHHHHHHHHADDWGY